MSNVSFPDAAATWNSGFEAEEYIFESESINEGTRHAGHSALIGMLARRH